MTDDFDTDAMKAALVAIKARETGQQEVAAIMLDLLDELREVINHAEKRLRAITDE